MEWKSEEKMNGTEIVKKVTSEGRNIQGQNTISHYFV